MGLLFWGGYYIEIGTMSIVENRQLKWEVGPVVVPKGWDYAAASMRKWENWMPKSKGGLRRAQARQSRKVPISEFRLRIGE